MNSARLAPRHLGYGIYWMWTLLCFQSTVAFLPLEGGLGAVLTSHSEFFSCSLVATVLAHIVWALALAARPQACDHAPWVCAVATSASVAAVGIVPVESTPWLAALGCVSGVASAMLDVRWLQVMGGFEGAKSGRAVCASICVALIGYQLLAVTGQLSQLLCIALVAVLPLLSALALEACCTQGEARMSAEQVGRAAHNARQITGSLMWPIVGSLAFFFVLGCVQGIVSSHADFNTLHMVMLASQLAAVALMYLALRRGLRMEVNRLYALVLALVSAGLLALPLVINAGTEAGLFCAAVLVSVGSMIIDVVVLCAVAHAAYNWQTSGALVGGLARGVTVGTMSVGHLAGNSLAEGIWSGSIDTAVFVVSATYLLILCCSLYLSHMRGARVDGGSGPAGPRPEAQADSVEAAIPAVPNDAPARPAQPSGAAQQEPADTARIAALAFDYHLSRRETDVFALVARGRSIPYVAETLTISENTARSHVRRIYDKLGVHSKQELIDLVEKRV